jgi:tetratricopeptide (TPR) repeat protein
MAKPLLDPKKDILAEYRAAADANPDSVEAQTNLGWGLYGEGRYADAIPLFEKAIALNDGFFDAYYGMALTCKKAGQTEPAIAAFEKAQSLLASIEDKNRALLMNRIILTHLASLRPHYVRTP